MWLSLFAVCLAIAICLGVASTISHSPADHPSR
jgi:hypothetical protein